MGDEGGERDVMSKEFETLSPTVPAPDKQHSIVSETYWKSIDTDGTFCVLAESGSGAKIYCVTDKDCNVISEMDTDENGRQVIERFEQVDSKKSNTQWTKIKKNEIPEPIFGSLYGKIKELV